MSVKPVSKSRLVKNLFNRKEKAALRAAIEQSEKDIIDGPYEEANNDYEDNFVYDCGCGYGQRLWHLGNGP